MSGKGSPGIGRQWHRTTQADLFHGFGGKVERVAVYDGGVCREQDASSFSLILPLFLHRCAMRGLISRARHNLSAAGRRRCPQRARNLLVLADLPALAAASPFPPALLLLLLLVQSSSLHQLALNCLTKVESFLPPGTAARSQQSCAALNSHSCSWRLSWFSLCRTKCKRTARAWNHSCTLSGGID